MEQVKQNMVELLPGIFAIRLRQKDNRWKITNGKLYVWHREQLSDLDIKEIDLDGSYSILFTTQDCTHQQARTIVDLIGTISELYRNYDSPIIAWFPTAIESLQSLLRARGLSDEKNYLLIRKTH